MVANNSTSVANTTTTTTIPAAAPAMPGAATLSHGDGGVSSAAADTPSVAGVELVGVTVPVQLQEPLIDEELLINEWEKCARAVDRLFFWLFTAMSVMALGNVFAPISW